MPISHHPQVWVKHRHRLWSSFGVAQGAPTARWTAVNDERFMKSLSLWPDEGFSRLDLAQGIEFSVYSCRTPKLHDSTA